MEVDVWLREAQACFFFGCRIVTRPVIAICNTVLANVLYDVKEPDRGRVLDGAGCSGNACVVGVEENSNGWLKRGRRTIEFRR